ncbi:hypothetical protein [Dickeya undicola]|uniref:hypothetical protein n=1 Tax=Dickeya undicola TaxID=1577887 RepID=UPI00067C39A5|nr:hypothetical protein [Dickeya undicola]
MEKELEDYINDVLGVCSSRAVFVINHIVKYGSINSEQIRNAGFVHGARAVGDVRDNGVPLVTRNIKSSDYRTIAEYTFGPASDIKKHKFGGRINFPTSLKGKLIERDGLFCAISKQPLPADELQIDHRVPYYISGDIAGERDPDDFMLLSKSLQRSKSWDCEHCDNLKVHFDIRHCKNCYWASPDNYTHVAMRSQRNINITWEREEVKDFDKLNEDSMKTGYSPQEIIKALIHRYYNN